MRVRLTVMALAGLRVGPLMIGPRRRLAGLACGAFDRAKRRSRARSDTFSHFMRIGVPRETAVGEHRVALVPEVVSKLRAKGLDVLVQSGAGADALIPDAAFVQAGAQIIGTPEHPDPTDVWEADVVVKIAPPDAEEIRRLGSGSIEAGFLSLLSLPQDTPT